MKILSFIPLLVWMLSFIPLCVMANKASEKIDVDGSTIVYLCGCVLWLIVGVCV